MFRWPFVSACSWAGTGSPCRVRDRDGGGRHETTGSDERECCCSVLVKSREVGEGRKDVMGSSDLSRSVAEPGVGAVLSRFLSTNRR
jgi:hypothetical protein